MKNIESQVENILNSNSKINAVVITDTYRTGKEEKVTIRNGIWIIRNHNAKYKIPESFQIPNEVRIVKGESYC